MFSKEMKKFVVSIENASLLQVCITSSLALTGSLI